MAGQAAARLADRGREGLRCFSPSGVTTNMHRHKFNGRAFGRALSREQNGQGLARWFPPLFLMADSELQAALNQSKVFDMNQVQLAVIFSWPLLPSCVHVLQKQMMSMQFLDDFKRAILVFSLVHSPSFDLLHECLLIFMIISPSDLLQAHANLFPHHTFGPGSLDDQVNFEPSRPIQTGMFSLKGKRDFLAASRTHTGSLLTPVLEQRSGSEGQVEHVDC